MGGEDGGEIGADAPPLAISDKIMDQELRAALAKALQMLGNQPNCFSLFGLEGPGGNLSPYPEQVLERIADSFTYGPIKSGDGTVTSATTTGVGSQQLDIGNGATVLVNASVQIQLNNLSTGAAFVTGSTYDQAITVLHELGHAYWDLYGPGTSAILPDNDMTRSEADNVKSSENNTNLLRSRCK